MKTIFVSVHSQMGRHSGALMRKVFWSIGWRLLNTEGDGCYNVEVPGSVARMLARQGYLEISTRINDVTFNITAEMP